MADENTPNPSKPGWKTPGFYLAAITTIGAALFASGADLGGAASGVALAISGLTAAGYAAYRAFQKSEDPKKPAWKTSEFWLSIAAACLSIAYASGLIADGGTADKVVGFVAAILAMAGYQVTKGKK
jgi:hypothetical protein